MNHVTINESISPNQVDIASLFDANVGEWGDVSTSFKPKVDAIIHSNVLFLNGELGAGTTEITINKNFAFYAKKTILEIYESINGNYVKSSYVASVEGKKITIPIVNNSFLIKGFLIGEFE